LAQLDFGVGQLVFTYWSQSAKYRHRLLAKLAGKFGAVVSSQSRRLTQAQTQEAHSKKEFLRLPAAIASMQEH
jgi:hypothetical protein